VTYHMKFGIKTRVPGLPEGENRIICTWYQCVTEQTDRQTDRRMLPLTPKLCHTDVQQKLTSDRT